MSDLVVIGEEYHIGMWSALGAEIFPVSTEEETKAALSSAIKSQAKIILISERLYKICEVEIMKMRKQSLPAILVLPLPGEEDSIGSVGIRQAMRTAVGVDIL